MRSGFPKEKPVSSEPDIFAEQNGILDRHFTPVKFAHILDSENIMLTSSEAAARRRGSGCNIRAADEIQ